MTPLAGARTFKDDWVGGLVTAYRRLVRQVPDAYGVMGRHAPVPGRVSVVIGGGSGHYPAFAGLVGPGLADAAVIGDVFTSPSAEQVYRTARAVDGGAGVVFSFGNYAGDVMHFGLAARRLAAEGIDSRTVIITDDIASAPAERSADRRGVAGDFFAFKVAGAAAARGDDLAGVAAAAEKANAMTRSFGVAFDGCTLPGQADPLFTVDPGRMELGLGIHGEPGMRTVDRVAPAELVDLLVDRLLPELPQVGDGRVAVLLNGLGRTTYEDLFVCYKRAGERLLDAGLRPYLPEVGEFVTSLDMAGLSLSLMVLDDELAELYAAPCHTPAFTSTGAAEPDGAEADGRAAERTEPSRTGSRGGFTARALEAARDIVTEHEEELGRLDAVAGDGDHGQGMVRGLTAAAAAARADGADGDGPRSAGATLLVAGTALADASGGASGALYGLLLTETGARLAAADGEVTTELLADALDAAYAAVCELGGGRTGEKTMLDALRPFCVTLREHRADAPAAALTAAAAAATEAAKRTADLVATRGRAARLGERGRGHADPGAMSLALMATAVAELLTHGSNGGKV